MSSILGRFLKRATGLSSPYGYQCRLACGPDADPEDPKTLRSGSDCEAKLINVPTGLGKTAAVALAWLWNRVLISNEEQRNKWPRRLVYCLPMRTLVEQTRDSVHTWLQNLNKRFGDRDAEQLAWLAKNSPVILMGDEEDDPQKKEWDLYPEKPAILIGTQDMLLSRALNRGYGMSRYRWPIQFGLLNNDCLWVMDEVQLMGPGVATACQLEAFRLPPLNEESVARFNSFASAHSATWYMSATANREHLITRDWRGIERPESLNFGLSGAEQAAPSGSIAERLHATKSLSLNRQRNFGSKEKAPESSLVEEICKRHRGMITDLKDAPATLTRRSLIVCNTVDRAKAVYNAIKKAVGQPGVVDVMLMHSRFRPQERKSQAEQLKPEHVAKYTRGQIVVATQVLEAGVDISSGILWSEVAPLASLVQRLGRLNRNGELGFARQTKLGFVPQAFIVGIESADPDDTKAHTNKEQREKARRDANKAHLPYDWEKCKSAWDSLEKLNEDASPASFNSIAKDVADSIPHCPYSLQKHELLDFFDTDANLSLGFTDVSPFVRGIDPDSDIYVLWRDWDSDGEGKPAFWPDYQREELCPVPIGKTKDGEARNILNKGWLWRGKDSGWISIRTLGDVAPGMSILLPTSAGGYHPETGWTGDPHHRPESCYIESEGPSDDDMLSSLTHGWRNISTHTLEVESEATAILNELASLHLPQDTKSAIKKAIHWHDIGKSHARWQSAAKKALEMAKLYGAEERYLPLAKFSLSDSPLLLDEDKKAGLTGDALKKKIRELRAYFKPGIAHEVASGLAFHQHEQETSGENRSIESLLSEYLIMSHHGHVRKVLRDETPRLASFEKDAEAVRGVRDGDTLPDVMINGATFRGCTLSTECRRMGREKDGHESYTRSVLRLSNDCGPFRLAYLEALFRAADMRASILAALGGTSHA